VLAGVGFELAVFTERAHQDRHLHRIGTEIYTVLEGEMSIEVEGERFVLTAGDSLLVRPGAAHAVEPARGPFLAQVVTIDSGGAGDKLVVE
jgi:quercetin dioxygenase-like cupin family protein